MEKLGMDTRDPAIKAESLRQLMENPGSEHWVRWERADFSIRKANKVEPERRVARQRRRGKTKTSLCHKFTTSTAFYLCSLQVCKETN